MPLLPRPCLIHSLPAELISLILCAVIAPESKRGFECHTLRKGAEFPMIAQRVCRRWRTIVCNTPALWSFLDIRRPRKGNYALYVQRSGAVGLHIRLEILPPTANPETRRVREVDLLIGAHAHRIHELILTGGTHEDTKKYIQGLRDTLPNLRGLVISGGPTMYSEPPSGLDLITPRLRSLSVDLGRLNWDPMPVAPDLEELYVGDVIYTVVIPTSLFAKVLKAYPYLRRLELHHPRIEGEWKARLVARTAARLMARPVPFILESLEELILMRIDVPELNRILRGLGAPSLRKLQVEGPRYETDGDPGSMPVLHLPLVETLLSRIQPQIAVEIAKQLPSLKHLDFQPPCVAQRWMDGALEALASHWRALRQPIPLETLCTRGVSPAALLALLGDSEGKAVPLLRKISVYYTDILLSEDQEMFAAHADARARISALVELDVRGLSPECMDARMRVCSWQEERNWMRKFSMF